MSMFCFPCQRRRATALHHQGRLRQEPSTAKYQTS
jgi:hypothetical protein